MKTIIEYQADDDAEMIRLHGPVIEERLTIGCDPYYGPYPGGDPRIFSPDKETNTTEEIEALRLAQEAAERGEYIDDGPQCAFLGNGHVHTRKGFGLVHTDVFPHQVLIRRYADGHEEELI
jgi:hypothetical protein